MKDCGTNNPSRHLKNAIDYITNPEKTNSGLWVSGLNCLTDYAYDQMLQTKNRYDKTDQRQGYHLIISFKEGEVTPEKAFEIIGEFAKEYLGLEYEAIYTAHDNTKNPHGHIVWNSVSCMTGKKYQYKKGDWQKEILQIVNRLCEENGLSTINIEGLTENLTKNGVEIEYNQPHYFAWNDMIKRDIDICVLQSETFEEMLKMLKRKGYQVKMGKHIAIKPRGMKRFRRLDTLGGDYTEEKLKERIVTEKLPCKLENVEADYSFQSHHPKIIKGYSKRYKKANMDSIQRKYYKHLYQVRRLKKKPYSQVWKYKDELKKLEQLKKECSFLYKNRIHTGADLKVFIDLSNDQEEKLLNKRKELYKRQYKYKQEFAWLKELEELKDEAVIYEEGDMTFEPSYKRVEELKKYITQNKYKLEELEYLKQYFEGKKSHFKKELREVRNDKKIAEKICAEYLIRQERILKQEKMKNIKKQDNLQHIFNKPEELEKKIVVSKTR